MISICSITHKQRDFLDTWAKGLIDQDYKDFEINLVIDEESLEEGLLTAKIVRNLFRDTDIEANGKLKIRVNRENLGGPASMTKSISMAQGDYIGILECDDYYLPNKLSESIQFIESNKLDGCHHDIDCILPDGEYRVAAWSKTCWQESRVTYERLCQMNTIYTCSFLCKSYMVKTAPSPLEISKHFSFLGDYVLFLDLVKNQRAKLGWLDKSLSVYRDSVGINLTKRDESVIMDGRIRDWAARGCDRSIFYGQ